MMRRVDEFAKFVILVLAAPLGCAADEIPLEDYGRSLNEAYCEWATGCGEFGDMYACSTYVSASLAFEVGADLMNGVANGSIVYDGERAHECIEALTGASCAVYAFEDTLWSSVCSRVFSGTIADGQLCHLDVQCRSSWCDVSWDACDGACCAGSCVTVPQGSAIGQACPLGLCVDGAFCDYGTETCQARKGEGVPCEYSEACASDLVCMGYPGVCARPRAEGEACIGGECGRLGLTCDPTRSICVAVQVAGEVCNPEVDLCGTSLSCSAATNTCMSAPGFGEPCAYECNGLQLYCAVDGLGGGGVCEARKNNGEACSYEDECLSWYCGASGTCAEPPVCVF